MLALLVPLFFNGTGGQLPLSPLERLGHLLAWANRPSLPADLPLGLRPTLHLDSKGGWQDARIRLVSDERADGLIRLDLVLGDREVAYGYAAEVVLLIVTRPASAAEAVLTRRLAHLPAYDAPGGRRARVLPLDDDAWGSLRMLTQPPRAESFAPFLRPARDRDDGPRHERSAPAAAVQ